MWPDLCTTPAPRCYDATVNTGDIRQFEWRLGLRLGLWGLLSIAAGAVVLAIHPIGEAPRGIALHAVIWGAIDLGLAVFAVARTLRRARLAPDETREITDTLQLRRLLRINGALDVVYIAAGATVAIVWRANPFLLGNGIGIAIQGLFLLVFDLVHARALPATPPAWYDPAP